MNIMLCRRNNVIEKMVNNSVALFFSAPEVIRSNDTHYPYRQNSDFWYLTHFAEPESILVLIKDPDGTHHSLIFNREKDPLMETWTGYRLGQAAAIAKLCVDKAYPFNDLATVLPAVISKKTALYHASQQYQYGDELVNQLMATLRAGSRQNLYVPDTMIDWRPLVHEMRLYKSSEEISLIRQACKITALGHIRAMQQCQPGQYEYQLEAEILHEFSMHGARWPSYNTIVGGGNNGCILHYENNSEPLNDGELVLIDAGCEYQYYAGDITRTFPVNGKFTPAQLDIYNLVLQSQQRAIELLQPGICVVDVNEQVIRTMVEGLVRLDILQGDIEQLIEQKAYTQFYMHGLGHYLGIDVHDVGDDKIPARERKLAPNMVITVEPGLYINKDAQVPVQYRGIGIRIEDNLLITENGNEVLTADVPKEPKLIEALMAKRSHTIA